MGVARCPVALTGTDPPHRTTEPDEPITYILCIHTQNQRLIFSTHASLDVREPYRWTTGRSPVERKHAARSITALTPTQSCDENDTGATGTTSTVERLDLSGV